MLTHIHVIANPTKSAVQPTVSLLTPYSHSFRQAPQGKLYSRLFFPPLPLIPYSHFFSQAPLQPHPHLHSPLCSPPLTSCLPSSHSFAHTEHMAIFYAHLSADTSNWRKRGWREAQTEMLTNGHRQTDNPTAVTLAAHACRGLRMAILLAREPCLDWTSWRGAHHLERGSFQPCLYIEELKKLKQIMLHYFHQYWQNVVECGKNARQHLNIAAPAQGPELHVGDAAPDMDAHVHHVHVYTCTSYNTCTLYSLHMDYIYTCSMKYIVF